MQIQHRANTTYHREEAKTDEPQMHQLVAEHQNELILQMIREGFVLNEWSINSSKLAVTEMVLDKKQVNALEQLLEQSEYEMCLKGKNTPIAPNKIYLALLDAGTLQYTVIASSGETITDKIDGKMLAQLKCELTPPLTMDQLESLPAILHMMEERKHIRPQIKTLALNKVSGIKMYYLGKMVGDKMSIEKNNLYLKYVKGLLNYTVVAPNDLIVSDDIDVQALIDLGCTPEELLHVNGLNHFLPAILKITTNKGHTVATQGYEPFLRLLNKRSLMLHLQSLTLKDCDLGDSEVKALAACLAQRKTLFALNLDNNHISWTGLKTLLSILFISKTSRSKLQTISLCFNEIKILKQTELDNLDKLLNLDISLQHLSLEGNLILSEKRNKTLVNMLQILWKKSGLEIGYFLSASFKKYEGGVLTLKTPKKARVKLEKFNDSEMKLYDEIKQFWDPIKDQPLINNRAVFNYLVTRGIGVSKDRIFKRLLIDEEMSPPSNNKELKRICKQLFDYPIFRSKFEIIFN
jgi:hypothetical protein